MNEMGNVEYLLKLYVEQIAHYNLREEMHNDTPDENDDYSFGYYKGRAAILKEIIQNRFGMKIEKLECKSKSGNDIYRAYNSVCSISVEYDY